jgi:hypothetical protein
MDRGFFHYGLFAQVQRAGGFFAIRRTRGPKFKTLRTLGPGDRVVRWTPTRRKWNGASIELRVIDYQVKGFRKGAIVTNVLAPRRMTREQFLGLNASSTWVTRRDQQGLYHQRAGRSRPALPSSNACSGWKGDCAGARRGPSSTRWPGTCCCTCWCGG